MNEPIDDTSELSSTNETEKETSKQQPEASYAYLLEKDTERTCQKDLDYCTWGKDGKPIPFCFEYPNDEKCASSSHSDPNILFMGCYDDPACDGKPVGKIKISSKDPPFAYTMDGKCERSGDLCFWLTNDIAVPQCAKENNTAQCRDKTDNLLIGCYTEETCGGNVMTKIFDQSSLDMNTSLFQGRQPVPKKTTTITKKKVRTPVLVLLIVLSIVLILISLLAFYVYRKQTKTPIPARKQQKSNI
jgi:hypothetical protein